MDDLLRAPLVDGHVQRRQHQLGPQMRLHRPADDTAKNVALAGTHQIQLRIEAFNVFNQERFGQPGNIVGSPTFGAILAADDGRIVQVGIKYTF